MNKPRIIHAVHPNGNPHPLKFNSLCGKMIRFGGIEIAFERPVTCKMCISILKIICPECNGTGMAKK